MLKLTEKPPRTDLTDRECSKIIGGTISGLAEMADLATVRKAVQWWADLDEHYWKQIFTESASDIAGALSSYIQPKNDEKPKK